MRAPSTAAAVACIGVAVAVVVTVALLRKEILAYCFDPLTARTSGVREGFIHYLLMLLLALLIVIGVRVAGSVLVTASGPAGRDRAACRAAIADGRRNIRDKRPDWRDRRAGG